MIGIIGGGGFIGTELVRILIDQGHVVRIIDKQPSKAFPDLMVEADVCDQQTLIDATKGCKTLYNLAAEHRDDVRPLSLYHDVNVTGAENTCAAADAHGIEKIIFTSSVAVYGTSEDELDETAALQPFNEYGRTKLAAEKIFSAWVERASTRGLTIVRPTVIFGPNNRGNVYNLLAQIARRRAMVIGDGNNRKSMAYVGNIAAFLAHALTFETRGVETYNYADKPDFAMKELVNLSAQILNKRSPSPLRVPYGLALALGHGFDVISKLTGQRLAISAVRVQKFSANTQFANSRVSATGFTPHYSLKESLTKTIRHEFASNLSADEQALDAAD